MPPRTDLDTALTTARHFLRGRIDKLRKKGTDVYNVTNDERQALKTAELVLTALSDLVDAIEIAITVVRKNT